MVISSNKPDKVGLTFNLASCLFILFIRQLDIINRFKQLLLAHVFIYLFKQHNYHLEVFRAELIQAAANRKTHLHQVRVPIEEIVVPDARTGVQFKDVREQGDHPLKEEDAWLDLVLVEELA